MRRTGGTVDPGRVSRTGVARGLASVAALVFAAGCLAAGGGAASPPRVTVISDSVLTSIIWHEQNLSVLAAGFDLDLNVAVCRRLAGVSCAFDGVAPPTVVDLLGSMQVVPAAVVVEMGYNDDPTLFRGEAETVIDGLVARGAKQIVWPTLVESTPNFVSINRDLIALMLAHPQLELVDWNGYAARHGDWFQTDHLHLTAAGGLGMATLLHQALVSPPAASGSVTLPPAPRGKPYRSALRAAAGCPCHWTLADGALAPGLTLSDNGTVSGTARAAGTFRADATYVTASALVGHVQITVRAQRAKTKTR